jgi:hypothetical protein
MRPHFVVATAFGALSVLGALAWLWPATVEAAPADDVAAMRAPIAERKEANEARERAAGRRRAPDAVPGGPDEARLWRLERMKDENGVFQPDAVAVAKSEWQSNAAHHDSLDEAGIGRFGWVERGPNNIGGRTRSLVIHPTNPNEMWAGAVGGGIWRSTNAGVSWAPVNDQVGNLAVCSLALAPTTPLTIYAGTGEGFYNGDAIVGDGVFKSTDGGATFFRLTATAAWNYVNRVAVSPANSSIVLAATRSPGGIQRSADGGATWTNVRLADACMQVAFDPNNGARCVADVYEGGAHRVVYSTNGGLTWTNAASGLVNQPGIDGRIELCYARSVPNMVYASCGTNGGLIWRSTDGGANWIQRTTSAGSGAAWYYNTLWVDPTDANFLVTGAYHLYKSADGGATLTQLSNGYINTAQPHPDQHQVVADPGFNGVSNRRVYVTNDGGVYVTADIRAATVTTGWTRRDQGYRTTQFYGAAGDGPTGRLTGGTQDNGHLTIAPNGNTATLTFGGDGGFAAMDPQNASYVYGEYVYAQVHRSTNGGSSASYIDGGISEAGIAANFVAPLVLDPSAPRRLYVGAASLWRTSDARAATVAWSNVKPAVGSNIAAIAVAPSDPNIVWVGHNDGRVYKTANALAAAPTWVAVDDNAAANPLPNRYVCRILIDRANPQTAFVGLGGFAGDNLRKTTNGGSSFTDLTGTGVTGLPTAPVYGIAQHPQIAAYLYVGTAVGIYASGDGGATWSTSNDGPADVSVDEVTFLNNSTTLLAATHGRGLWTIAIREPVVAQLGQGCAGTFGTPALTASAPALGKPVALLCANLRPGQQGLFALGVSATIYQGLPLPLDLTALGMPGCFARTSAESLVLGMNTTGVLESTIAMPTTPSSLGFQFFVQAFSQDPLINAFGAAASNALALTVGN